MANTKSAKKAIRVTKKNTEVNKARKSRIKTFFRKVIDAIKSMDIGGAKKSFVEFESELMKGVNKGVYKKNTASRKLSRTAANIKKAEKGEEVLQPVKKKSAAKKAADKKAVIAKKAAAKKQTNA